MTRPLELQEACACNQPQPVTSGKESWPRFPFSPPPPISRGVSGLLEEKKGWLIFTSLNPSFLLATTTFLILHASASLP